jgi:hypothetical protein
MPTGGGMTRPLLRSSRVLTTRGTLAIGCPYDSGMPEDYEPSPEWATGVDCDLNPPVAVRKRDGSPALRHERPYLSGRVWAIDRNGKRAGYQSYDVYTELRILLLDSAGMNEDDGDNGEDNRYQGGARAMLDELDRRYPEPEWWMASADGALHTQEGVDLMRGRHLNGRSTPRRAP